MRSNWKTHHADSFLPCGWASASAAEEPLSGASLALRRRSLWEFQRFSIVDTRRDESPDWLLLATLQLLLLLLSLLHTECWSLSLAADAGVVAVTGEVTPPPPMNTDDVDEPNSDTAAKDPHEEDVDEEGDGSFMLILLTLDILGTSSLGVPDGDVLLLPTSRCIWTAVHELRRRRSLPARFKTEEAPLSLDCLLRVSPAMAIVTVLPRLVKTSPASVLTPLRPPPPQPLCFIMVTVVGRPSEPRPPSPWKPFFLLQSRPSPSTIYSHYSTF